MCPLYGTSSLVDTKPPAHKIRSRAQFLNVSWRGPWHCHPPAEEHRLSPDHSPGVCGDGNSPAGACQLTQWGIHERATLSGPEYTGDRHSFVTIHPDI